MVINPSHVFSLNSHMIKSIIKNTVRIVGVSPLLIHSLLGSLIIIFKIYIIYPFYNFSVDLIKWKLSAGIYMYMYFVYMYILLYMCILYCKWEFSKQGVMQNL